MKLPLCLFFFMVLLSSCKKDPYYGISDEMKEYFVYQKGSYWIYKDDSTSIFDSTYVKYYNHIPDETGYSGMIREIIILDFRSHFLSDLEVGYFCPGPNCLTIASRLEYPNDTNNMEISGPVAYYYPFIVIS